MEGLDCVLSERGSRSGSPAEEAFRKEPGAGV